MPVAGPIHQVEVRVNYSETDQMGVVYHARYLVWLDIARTEFLRAGGLSYREVEQMGYRLALSDLAVRYRRPARYDDCIRIRCWVRDVASRRVEFGYIVERADDGVLLATATTALMTLDSSMRPVAMPDAIRALLPITPDPVRL